jgi:hypothetical protein
MPPTHGQDAEVAQNYSRSPSQSGIQIGRRTAQIRYKDHLFPVLHHLTDRTDSWQQPIQLFTKMKKKKSHDDGGNL